MQRVGICINRFVVKSRYFIINENKRFLFSKSTQDDPKESSEKNNKSHTDENDPEKLINNNETTDENISELKDKKLNEISVFKEKIEKLEHQLKYAVAELKNIQNRVKQQVDEARDFGASKFIKEIFVIADTLETVIDKTPKASLDSKPSSDESKQLQSDLKDLFVGVEMTNSMLQKAFKNHSVVKCNPLGDDFDPNFHLAKYEIPKNSSKYPPGKVGEVIRVGYLFNGRLLRAAEVGVVKKE